MRRVMIIGQPGSGKSTLARAMGAITRLPVVHIDHIHWQAGWIERSQAEKARLCRDVHARPVWIFKGGHTRSWPERLARADTLVWLDLPLRIRLSRVLRRTMRHYGRTRPDLPEGCPERFSPEFVRYIWATRRTGRESCTRLHAQVWPEQEAHHLTETRTMRSYLDGLRRGARSERRHSP